jgi:hypothetical protein
MSDADRQAPAAQTQDQSAQAEGENAQGEVISRYEVVPYKDTASEADLYSFRSAMPQFLPSRPAAQPAQPVQAAPAALPGQPAQAGQPAGAAPSGAATQPAQAALPAMLVLERKKLLMYVGCGSLAVLLLGLASYLALNKQQPIAPFVDLGQNNVAAAGLSGRLIAKWDGSTKYELHLDPLSPQQSAAFGAVAMNPPHPLTLALHITNASGSVVCQKEILFPFSPTQDPADAEAQEFEPQKTFDGDTVQNVAGSDGQLEEIVVTGPLTCPLKAYRLFTNWDFSSSFPTVAEQQDWLRQQQAVTAQLRRKAAEAHANALIPARFHLPAPIDGDDVIVSDNPSHGTVATRSGRTFYIGLSGALGRAPGWQVFPAAIHYHCDVKANCVLTRPDASTTLSARLVR